MEKKPVHTAAAYIRVSTEDQIEFSPDSQQKRIQEYADSHQILLPEAFIFVDEGISGKSADNRPAFQHMIQTARQKPHPFDLILVWKFSRFARNRQDSIFYKSMLRKECGIDVVSITEQLSDDPTSILIEALLEAMDEYYSINLAQEVRRGMNEKFTRGGVVGPPPFGYRILQGKCTPDPSTASVVPMIFSDFLSGMSCRQIADKLNQMQIQTIRGNAFEARTVRYILGNPFYLGFQRRHISNPSDGGSMTIVPSAHPPLIPESVFDEARHLLQLTSHPYTRSTCPSHPIRMLDGLIRCGNCNATLTRTGQKDTLQCCRYTRGQCRVSHSVSSSYIEALILEQLQNDWMTLPFASFSIRQNDRKKSRKKIPAFKFFLMLCARQLPEELSNLILRVLIDKIVFSRKNHTIQIFYKI